MNLYQQLRYHLLSYPDGLGVMTRVRGSNYRYLRGCANQLVLGTHFYQCHLDSCTANIDT